MNPGEVLIVDDSPTSRMIIQRCIEMAGIAIPRYSQAENGLEALGMLKRQAAASGPPLPSSPAGFAAGLVVVTDINMPKMDGRAFIRLLRDDPEIVGVDAIVVSSIADAAVEAELKALGVIRLVKKPVSPQKILEAFGGRP